MRPQITHSSFQLAIGSSSWTKEKKAEAWSKKSKKIGGCFMEHKMKTEPIKSFSGIQSRHIFFEKKTVMLNDMLCSTKTMKMCSKKIGYFSPLLCFLKILKLLLTFCHLQPALLFCPLFMIWPKICSWLLSPFQNKEGVVHEFFGEKSKVVTNELSLPT